MELQLNLHQMLMSTLYAGLHLQSGMSAPSTSIPCPPNTNSLLTSITKLSMAKAPSSLMTNPTALHYPQKASKDPSRGSSTEAPANIFIFGGIPKFSKPQNNNKNQTDGEQAASNFFDNSKSPPPPWSPNFHSNCSPPA